MLPPPSSKRARRRRPPPPGAPPPLCSCFLSCASAGLVRLAAASAGLPPSRPRRQVLRHPSAHHRLPAMASCHGPEELRPAPPSTALVTGAVTAAAPWPLHASPSPVCSVASHPSSGQLRASAAARRPPLPWPSPRLRRPMPAAPAAVVLFVFQRGEAPSSAASPSAALRRAAALLPGGPRREPRSRPLHPVSWIQPPAPRVPVQPPWSFLAAMPCIPHR